MIKIDKAYFDKITRKDNSYAARLRKLSIGEELIIYRREWINKTDPSVLCGWLKERDGLEFKTKTLPSKQGWAILRVK